MCMISIQNKFTNKIKVFSSKQDLLDEIDSNEKIQYKKYITDYMQYVDFYSLSEDYTTWKIDDLLDYFFADYSVLETH